MNGLNLSQNQINALLKMAGKKLGTDPNQLKQKLENGNVGEVVQQLGGDQAGQINQLLNNPTEMEKFFNSPQMKDMMNKLMNNGK